MSINKIIFYGLSVIAISSCIVYVATSHRQHGTSTFVAERHQDTSAWRVADLGTLGGAKSCAYAVNDIGQVVGESDTPTRATHAFLWQNGKMNDLGVYPNIFQDYPKFLPASTSSVANSSAVSVNRTGQTVGQSDPVEVQGQDLFQYHAALWQGNGITSLSSPFYQDSQATKINDNGRIVGQVLTDASTGPSQRVYEAHPFLFSQGQMELPNLEPDALDINNKNEVVGARKSGKLLDVVVLDSGKERILTGIPRGWRFVRLLINDLDQVAGVGTKDTDADPRYYTIEPIRSFLWTPSKVTILKGLPKFPEADVRALGKSFAVGDVRQRPNSSSLPWPRSAAVMWKGDQPIDLNTLIPPHCGWYLEHAYGTNAAGQIVGSGIYNGSTHAYLLTPGRKENQ